MTKRTRNTPAIRARYGNIRKLVAEIRADGAVNSSEASALLGVSVETARAYLHELLEEHVIEPARPIANQFDTRAYRLTECALMVDAYLLSIDLPIVVKKPKCTPRPPKPAMPRHQGRIPLSGVYIMSEGFRAPAYVCQPAPPRDPLVVALFGPARAGAEVRA